MRQHWLRIHAPVMPMLTKATRPTIAGLVIPCITRMVWILWVLFTLINLRIPILWVDSLRLESYVILTVISHWGILWNPNWTSQKSLILVKYYSHTVLPIHLSYLTKHKDEPSRRDAKKKAATHQNDPSIYFQENVSDVGTSECNV